MTYFITVHGLVQGVGFRPYVKRLADSMSLAGTVCNLGGSVGIRLKSDTDTLEAFIKRLYLSLPEGAKIERIETSEALEEDFDGFEIVESDEADFGAFPFIPADIGTCGDCARELFDQSDRRFMHPFISCAVCGPRYSIISSVPYDREGTVMRDFTMCEKCSREYAAAKDRRFYAQTLGCHDCGPKLFFNGQEEKAFDRLVSSLQSGGIAAIKDIGGYHFACDALNESAVARLRSIKLREAKPFAVMFASVEQIRRYAFVSKEEEALLRSPARPIVLLEKTKELAGSVCGGLPTLGAMLPCNPIQLMLAERLAPLVMTSGNISGEPIITDDGTAAELAKNNGMDILSHDRRILMPLDDSVARVICGRPQLIRRARGYVPEPVDVPGMNADSLLAFGGDLKAVFGFAKGGRVIMSQHYGDMEDAAVRTAYLDGLEHMGRLYAFAPKKVLCDMHPSYFSSIEAENFSETARLEKPLRVQHHLAHIMSAAAEHGIKDGFTGAAMDGTGFGTDGAVWGGEIFTVNGGRAMRRFQLRYIDVVGGDNAARDARLLLRSYLYAAGLLEDENEAALIGGAIENGINTFKTSSMGRLFDAVSAMLGICGFNRYEGECAVRLEAAAARALSSYPLSFDLCAESGEIKFDRLFADIASALRAGAPPESLARGFHIAVAELILNAASICGNRRLLLSGGVFMNRILTEELARRGADAGFEIFWNEKVPPGDGGLVLGQLAAAAYGIRME